MNTISPLYAIFVIIVFMWVLDDIFLYFMIEFAIVIMFVNQADIFGTIPATFQDNLNYILLGLLVIAFAKHAYLANRARNKYHSIVGDM